jgi:hypothetical protein
LWNNIQEHLNSGLQPPFWIDAYHDANRRFASGDYRGALLEAVVAIEAFIRAELLSAVPPDETAIRKRLNLWAMTDVLDNFTKIGALRALGIPAETIKKIKEAFKIRNEIMHGKTVILKEDFLTETLSSAKMVVRA